MEIELQIEGMTCQHCQRAVVQALMQVPGVEGVEVSLLEKKATVVGNPSLDALREAVQEEGFSLASE
jgi:copper chaperone